MDRRPSWTLPKPVGLVPTLIVPTLFGPALPLELLIVEAVMSDKIATREQLVTIEQYQFLPEADAIRMHLQAEGIEAFLADAETVSTDWALGNAVGYIKLQVPASQEVAGRAVLELIRARRLEREGASNANTNRCLACDGELLPDQASCLQCGWSYGTDGEADEPETEERSNQQSSTDSDQMKPESMMDSLRTLKRPMVLILLIPFFTVLFLYATTLVLWTLGATVNPHW